VHRAVHREVHRAVHREEKSGPPTRPFTPVTLLAATSIETLLRHYRDRLFGDQLAIELPATMSIAALRRPNDVTTIPQLVNCTREFDSEFGWRIRLENSTYADLRRRWFEGRHQLDVLGHREDIEGTQRRDRPVCVEQHTNVAAE
jgi:hypothetical protein